MRSIVSLILSFVASQLVAQGVTYWTGTSNNPDPIMRHHEAFMVAFIGYIQKHSARLETAAMTDEDNNDRVRESIHSAVSASCQIETVASVTNDGQESLTILVGKGQTVDYAFESLSIPDKNETKLIIKYHCDKEPRLMESVHSYRVIADCRGGDIGDRYYFSYKCESVEKN